MHHSSAAVWRRDKRQYEIVSRGIAAFQRAVDGTQQEFRDRFCAFGADLDHIAAELQHALEIGLFHHAGWSRTHVKRGRAPLTARRRLARDVALLLEMRGISLGYSHKWTVGKFARVMAAVFRAANELMVQDPYDILATACEDGRDRKFRW